MSALPCLLSHLRRYEWRVFVGHLTPPLTPLVTRVWKGVRKGVRVGCERLVWASRHLIRESVTRPNGGRESSLRRPRRRAPTS